MKPLGIRTNDADLAILKNKINIDKFLKKFEEKTNSSLLNITNGSGYKLMYHIK